MPLRSAVFIDRSALLPCERLYQLLLFVVSVPARVNEKPEDAYALFSTESCWLICEDETAPVEPLVITWKYTLTLVAANGAAATGLAGRAVGGLAVALGLHGLDEAGLHGLDLRRRQLVAVLAVATLGGAGRVHRVRVGGALGGDGVLAGHRLRGGAALAEAEGDGPQHQGREGDSRSKLHERPFTGRPAHGDRCRPADARARCGKATSATGSRTVKTRARLGRSGNPSDGSGPRGSVGVRSGWEPPCSHSPPSCGARSPS